MRKRLALLVSVSLSLAATACGGPEEDVKTKTRAEVEAAIAAQADAIATTAGSALDGWRTNAAPCTGKNGETATDGKWHLTGFANIPIPPDKQVSTLGTIRDSWRQQGFEITDDRTFADNTRSSVSMRNQAGEMTVSLSTTMSLDSAALIVASFCYMPAAGEDPANDG